MGAKVEVSPKGFTLGVNAEIKNKLFNLPQVLINAQLYGLVLGPRLKKQYHQIWAPGLKVPAFFNMLKSKFQHFLIS
jgi:hypothetical protein